MFIRFFETAFNTVAVAGLPLIFIELPPCDSIRVINKLPSWSVSKPLSRSKHKDSFDKSQNKAETNALSQPARIKSFEVRSPNIAFIASIIIDLPAPVSPVNTLSPVPKSISVFSITAIFSICKDLIIKIPYIIFLSSLVNCCACASL